MEQQINMGVRQHRFPKGMELPVPPQGMELTKFHGEPRLISARKEGEPVNKSGFTSTQQEELTQMEARRLANIRETLALQELLEYENSNVESQVIFTETLIESV